MTANNTNMIQSVLKAAEMLKIVGYSENGVKLSQVAETMNQKLPAIHHLSQTLISCGFIRKNQDNVLTLGGELIKLAANARDGMLLDIAAAEMSRLYNLFPKAVIVLAEINAPRVELAMRISYDRPNVIQKEKEQIFNIYVNAVALMAMAMAKETERELMMDRQPFSEYGILLWKETAAFLEYLEKIKADGYAISPFDRQTSFRIAVPIVSPDGELKASIGASVPVSKLEPGDENLIKEELLKSAAAIGGKL